MFGMVFKLRDFARQIYRENQLPPYEALENSIQLLESNPLPLCVDALQYLRRNFTDAILQLEPDNHRTDGKLTVGGWTELCKSRVHTAIKTGPSRLDVDYWGFQHS